MQLTDGALLGTRKRLEHLHVTQHRERNRDDGIITAHIESARPRVIVDDDLVGTLVNGDHLRAVADARPKHRQERVRQVIHSAATWHIFE